ncbi:MAG: WcaF family extracellular polysaccharide biosynthesis acetyltransferase [Armatimonadetes bacterium]|nr:WcaF family extracellular polysaccharide biosynthesis acetyltransferase [Armatimonadota bacterium]
MAAGNLEHKMEPGSGRLRLQESVTPWPLSTKLKRVAWSVCQALLFRPGNKRFGSKWRVNLLRMWGAQIGERCDISPSARILQPWKLTMGDQSCIGDNVDVYNFAMITLGDQTVVSQRTYLCTGTHDFEDPTMPLLFYPITIGSECWIAAEVFVAPGVTIGDRVVVGARSVVVKNLPAAMVCAGHPCKPLKERVIKLDKDIVRDTSIYE